MANCHIAVHFDHLRSPLNAFQGSFNILNLTTEKIDGLHFPYVYGGTQGTVFCWHIEDYHLYCANYQIDGAAKVRYAVPPLYIKNFFHDQRGKSTLQRDTYLCKYPE